MSLQKIHGRGTPDVPSERGLTVRHGASPAQWDDKSFQQLWMALQRREWRSLAVLPANEGMDSLGVAETLASIAWWNRGQPVAVVDFRELSVRLLEHQLDEVAHQTLDGQPVLIALKSIFESPTAASVARRADAVVLCLELEQTSMVSAKRTLTEVGQERFVGALLIRPSPSR